MNYIRFLYQVFANLIEKRYSFNRARTFKTKLLNIARGGFELTLLHRRRIKESLL